MSDVRTVRVEFMQLVEYNTEVVIRVPADWSEEKIEAAAARVAPDKEPDALYPEQADPRTDEVNVSEASDDEAEWDCTGGAPREYRPPRLPDDDEWQEVGGRRFATNGHILLPEVQVRRAAEALRIAALDWTPAGVSSVPEVVWPSLKPKSAPLSGSTGVRSVGRLEAHVYQRPDGVEVGVNTAYAGLLTGVDAIQAGDPLSPITLWDGDEYRGAVMPVRLP